MPMSFVCYVGNILVNKQVLIQQIIYQVFYLEFKSTRTKYIYIYIYICKYRNNLTVLWNHAAKVLSLKVDSCHQE